MSKQSHTASYFEALLRECESKRHHGTLAWFDVDDALEFTALTMTLSSPHRNHIAGSASTSPAYPPEVLVTRRSRRGPPTGPRRERRSNA